MGLCVIVSTHICKLLGRCIHMNRKKFISRNPREHIQYPKTKDITIDDPPQINKKDKEKVYPVIIQCIVAIMNFSLISLIISKDINTSLLCAAITSIGSLITILITNRSEKKKNLYKIRKMEAKYTHYLAEVDKSIYEERAAFDAYYGNNYPSVHDCIQKIETRPSWDRFIDEPDFLLVRIGYHRFREFNVVYQKNFFDEDDLNIAAATKEIEKHGFTDYAPILLDINNKAVGFWGEKEALIQMFIRILIDCTFHHCYTDVKFVIIDPDGIFRWLSELSFLQDNSEGKCLYASTHKEISNVLAYIEKIKGRRENSILSNKADSSIPIPYYIVCVFGEKAEKLQAFNSITASKEISVSLLFFYKDFDKLLNCKTKVKCEADESVLFQKLKNIRFRTETVERNEIELYIKQLSFFRCESAGDFSLPNLTSIFEGYGITKLEDLEVLNRWKKNKYNVRLSIPVGIDALGKQFEFDLHEVEAGPHCIVAGSTGSGKSEFLTTMILSFAINYPPEKISFWIFDGKGGGLIAPLENLPHISKSVTQLDESVFVEVTHSLKDELIRRQVLLRQYGGDFESYNAVNNCSLPPLPHLFIIVDEFAEIKRYYPEFMDSLMSAVRVGRSLGIHLVLSTQKPAGVVNDQILANCRSKICLRTYAEADSLEILGDSIATTFINSGRAAIRVGNDMISVFQTFWSHAGSEEESVPQSKALVEYISKIYSIYCSK